MRQVLSISLPNDLAKEIRKNVTKRGFGSLSAYFQHLTLADREHLISEAELVETVRQSRKEYKKGQFLVAESLARLI